MFEARTAVPEATDDRPTTGSGHGATNNGYARHSSEPAVPTQRDATRGQHPDRVADANR